MTTLTLVTRSGCSLCEAMQLELSAYLAGSGVTVELRDVDEEPELLERYSDQVPVLLCHGQPICHYFFDPDALVAVVGH